MVQCRRRQLVGPVGGTYAMDSSSRHGLNLVEGRREVVERSLLLLGVAGSRGSRPSREVVGMLEGLVEGRW